MRFAYLRALREAQGRHAEHDLQSVALRISPCKKDKKKTIHSFYEQGSKNYCFLIRTQYWLIINVGKAKSKCWLFPSCVPIRFPTECVSVGVGAVRPCRWGPPSPRRPAGMGGSSFRRRLVLSGVYTAAPVYRGGLCGITRSFRRRFSAVPQLLVWSITVFRIRPTFISTRRTTNGCNDASDEEVSTKVRKFHNVFLTIEK